MVSSSTPRAEHRVVHGRVISKRAEITNVTAPNLRDICQHVHKMLRYLVYCYESSARVGTRGVYETPRAFRGFAQPVPCTAVHSCSPTTLRKAAGSSDRTHAMEQQRYHSAHHTLPETEVLCAFRGSFITAWNKKWQRVSWRTGYGA